MRKSTWCLVCDEGRGHLFREGPPGSGYELIATYNHPEGRARSGDLVSDARGRKPIGGYHGDGLGGRPAASVGGPGAAPDTDPKDVEAQKFARQLAATLGKGLDDHAYEAWVLVAPPRFLGLIKATVGEQVRKRLRATLDKDLAPMEPREIVRRLAAARDAAQNLRRRRYAPTPIPNRERERAGASGHLRLHALARAAPPVALRVRGHEGVAPPGTRSLAVAVRYALIPDARCSTWRRRRPRASFRPARSRARPRGRGRGRRGRATSRTRARSPG